MKPHQHGCLENKDLTKDNTHRHANMEGESLLSGGRVVLSLEKELQKLSNVKSGIVFSREDYNINYLIPNCQSSNHTHEQTLCV